MYRCWLPLCHCHRLVHTHRAVGVVDAVGRAGRWRRSKNRSDADNFARHGCAMFGKRCLDALIDKGREPVVRRRELLFITHDRTPLDYEPISKSFEEDNEAGKLDKAEEIVGVVLPTNEDPALPLNPGEE